ncbi:30S ribosomal protein S1 [Fusibacter paucivorans]|uniref:30S ribosomal protein S1 n=1 Tax=Fusibacter paucivorans TaxID=76009 RepID=A0ABS5PPP1_9FIRM|nr:30S ribosomal protein S1 [Fusibacter paucivorans]MBS7527006.1 30S ribosomal protein S1 [Fusibacter paucivorans]
MEEKETMAAALAEMDQLESLQTGDIVKGTVMSVNEEEAIVNLNYMADGILSKEEIEGGSTAEIAVGDTVDVYIVKTNDGEGNVKLSLKKAEAQMVWEELQGLVNANQPLNLKVKEAVKGGVVGMYKGARIFIPASQVALHYVEDLTVYAGTSFEVKIIELDMDKKRVVASRRAIEEVERAKRKADTLARLAPKDKLKGTVVRLANYGAFVDLGDVDGLVHVSQMSWRRVKHPSEVVKEGDVVEVEVLSVDREKEKISLKLATVEESPWQNIDAHYQVDDIVMGKVVRITNFGAFVALEEGIEGLVHISELSTDHVAKVSDVVNEGDEVEVLVLSIDAAKEKISLSMKAVAFIDETETFEVAKEEAPQAATLSDLFGDKLKNLKF